MSYEGTCAPPETNLLGLIKKMHEANFEILVKERGVLGVDKVIKALKLRNMQADLWLLPESPQYKVLSYGSSDEVEVLLVPRDE